MIKGKKKTKKKHSIDFQYSAIVEKIFGFTLTQRKKKWKLHLFQTDDDKTIDYTNLNVPSLAFGRTGSERERERVSYREATWCS